MSELKQILAEADRLQAERDRLAAELLPPEENRQRLRGVKRVARQ